MRFQERGQNKIVRLPRSARFVAICRSSIDPDECFPGERIHRLAPAAILNGEQAELLEIEAGSIGGRLLRATKVGREKQDRKCKKPESKFQSPLRYRQRLDFTMLHS